MLVLNRREGEGVLIGGCELRVAEITPSKVLLLFTPAAGSVRVFDLFYGEERELGGAVVYARRRRADQVRLQINAPQSVRVLRAELAPTVP